MSGAEERAQKFITGVLSLKHYNGPDCADCAESLASLIAAEREAGRREMAEEAIQQFVPKVSVKYSGVEVRIKIRALAASEAGRDGRGGE